MSLLSSSLGLTFGLVFLSGQARLVTESIATSRGRLETDVIDILQFQGSVCTQEEEWTSFSRSACSAPAERSQPIDS
jgi:hypothetical protein